jgi:hypothetical protein
MVEELPSIPPKALLDPMGWDSSGLDPPQTMTPKSSTPKIVM